MINHQFKNLTCLLILAAAIICYAGCRNSATNSASKPSAKATKKDTVKLSVIPKKTDTVRTVVITNPTLKKLSDRLDKYLAQYDTISVFDSYDLKSLHILRKNLDSDERMDFDTLTGKYRGHVIIEYLQGKILPLISKILYNKHIGEYKLEDVISLVTAASDDNRLYAMAFDEKTGGSYHSSLSFYQYRAEDGHIYNYLTSMEKGGDRADAPFFNRDGYSSIETIQTKTGTKYLLQGSVVGCNTCMGNYIELMHFKRGEPIDDFSYQLDVRFGGDDRGGSIDYDPKKKQIDVSYYTDDLTPICTCDDYQKMDDAGNGSDSAESHQRKPCTCTFVFNGETFVLKSHPKKHHKHRRH